MQTNIVHALLYLILSLLAVAVIFYVLGAPFAAVLEAIVYAGAILVLFLFVIMMLNLGQHTRDRKRMAYRSHVSCPRGDVCAAPGPAA